MTESIGHNSIGVDQPTFDKYVAKISAAESKVAIAKEELKKARKAARAEGIILGVFDRTRQLADMTRSEQTTEMIHTATYLRWLRAPIGAQFEFNLDADPHEEETDEAATSRLIQDAEAAGWRAGLEGKLWEDDNPHDGNTDVGQAWLKGFRDGQAKNAEAMKPAKPAAA